MSRVTTLESSWKESVEFKVNVQRGHTFQTEIKDSDHTDSTSQQNAIPTTVARIIGYNILIMRAAVVEAGYRLRQTLCRPLAIHLAISIRSIGHKVHSFGFGR